MINRFEICKVCGYKYKNYYPWGKDGNTPTYDICICCGIEFGYEDDTIASIRIVRQKWIENGMKWDEQPQPPDYNPSKQFKNIPPEWK